MMHADESPEPNGWSLTLLGSWQVQRVGETVLAAKRQQRIIAALAVLGPMQRRQLAGVLWPECSEARAAGSLRAGVWHVRHGLPGLLAEFDDVLAISPAVSSDFSHARSRIAECVSAARSVSPPDIPQLRRDLLVCSRAILLPGWYDDWLAEAQEELRRSRLGALESIALRFIDYGYLDEGIRAASLAAAAEPLRESARRLVILGHLEAGNNAEAVRVYREFRALLALELGASPSPLLERLIESAGPLRPSAASLLSSSSNVVKPMARAFAATAVP